MAAARQLLIHSTCHHQHSCSSCPRFSHRGGALPFSVGGSSWKKLQRVSIKESTPPAKPARALPQKDDIVSIDGDDGGISLGSVKLPGNTDIALFETLLFQWANSLCQGANLPLPVPLKVDKVQGGVRLGFIEIDDGKTEVLVYIDCVVFPATDSSGPLFQAIRNGTMKDKVPPGEPRIMRSLLQALQKAVEIARV
ncbi:uncharacterized protein [Typha angustifolia]|uniref:uncharacterized protein n=1 Tax=Typha angustifolia TaxID=59011 RepID=UPI003C2ACDBC